MLVERPEEHFRTATDVLLTNFISNSKLWKGVMILVNISRSLSLTNCTAGKGFNAARAIASPHHRTAVSLTLTCVPLTLIQQKSSVIIVRHRDIAIWT
jgi:hypothetical protein